MVFLVFALLATSISLSCGREDFPSSPVVSELVSCAAGLSLYIFDS